MKNDHEELIQFRNQLFYIGGSIAFIAVGIGFGLLILEKLFEPFSDGSIRTLLSIAGVLIIVETGVIFRSHRSYSQGVQEGIRMMTEFHAQTVKASSATRGNSVVTVSSLPSDELDPAESATSYPVRRARLFDQIIQRQPSGGEDLTTPFPPPGQYIDDKEFSLSPREETALTTIRRPKKSSSASLTAFEVGQSNIDDVVEG